MRFPLVFGWIWAVFWASWIVAAAWQRSTAARAGTAAEFPSRLFQIAGFLLLFGTWYGPRMRALVLWRFGQETLWALAGVTAAGFAFCWWARLQLGALWSSTVERKADHRIVDTGPYALVRHPIYTGILIASFATAAASGAPSAVLGAALVTIGFWLKARLEERFLRDELGAAAYDAYRRRVPMLIPFAPP